MLNMSIKYFYFMYYSHGVLRYIYLMCVYIATIAVIHSLPAVIFIGHAQLIR